MVCNWKGGGAREEKRPTQPTKKDPKVMRGPGGNAGSTGWSGMQGIGCTGHRRFWEAKRRYRSMHPGSCTFTRPRTQVDGSL